jgi:alanyl-tRNA synthetase
MPLPRPSIDTGMGLERLTAVLQGVDSNYDTDLFQPIIARTRALLGHDEATMRANLVPYRVIADHSRAITFLIGDGVLPGNEGRSYVLRLILRRAARFGKLLGLERPFLAETAQAVIDTMGDHYTELRDRGAFIRQVITREEERFLSTLSVGLARLDALALRLQQEGSRVVPGDEAFRLYDTYGFPLELTRDAALEKGLTVDEAGFRLAMKEQRERARAAQRFAVGSEEEFYRRLELPRSAFLGFETCRVASRVVAIVAGDGKGRRVERIAAEEREDVRAERAEVILEASPFYAESGGQVGDVGELRNGDARFAVEETYCPVPEVIVHRGRMVAGTLSEGDTVLASVDEEQRLDITRNHTATHLLHRALREVLGGHAVQAGSLVAPDRLRFDFSHLAPLSPDELRRVEALVNAQVRANAPVITRSAPYDEAVRSGAIALFGEKYGDVVRVVSVEGFTAELCGGTHLSSTGQIGLFLLVSEASVGSGVRRIEAVTGRGAEAFVRDRLEVLTALGNVLIARPGEELARTQGLLDQLREQRHLVQDLQRQLAVHNVDALLNNVQQIKGAAVLVAQVQVADANALREMGDRLRDKLGSAVVVLGAVVGGRPLVVVAVTADLVTRGLHAGQLAGAAAQRMGGGGGGRPNMAQAGGKVVNALPAALAAVPELIAAALG